MSQEEMMKPRFKIISDWPGNTKYEIGDILKGYSPGCGGGDLILNDKGESVWLSPEKYPHLFKKLEWWEDRTIEQLKSVQFVKVITYVGYWRVGDIVKTNGFIMEANKPYGYKLTNHFHPIYCIQPATKEEYENQK